MSKKNSNQSFFLNPVLFLLFIGLTIAFIVIAKGILFPLCFGFIFANLLYPGVQLLHHKWKWNYHLSVFSVLFAAISLISFGFILLGKEFFSIFNDLPKITEQLNQNFLQVEKWIYQNFGFTLSQQKDFIEESVTTSSVFSPKMLQSVFNVTDVLTNVALTPIYTLFILIYKENLNRFVLGFARDTHRGKTLFVLKEIHRVMLRYVSGLLLEMLFVTSFIALGYWIIGVKYVFFLAVLSAILNLIPYLGVWIACGISVLMSFVAGMDFSMMGYIVLVNVIVQLIDNNVLIPFIIGSKISINALATFLGVIVGGSIAGVGGMFLAIPTLAVLKVIFSHSQKLKPFANLIGEEHT